MVFDRYDLLDKSDWLELSEENGNFQKETKRYFGEKRV